MSDGDQPASVLGQPSSPQHGNRETADPLHLQEPEQQGSVDAAVQKILEKAKVTSEKNRKVTHGNQWHCVAMHRPEA